ncbi:MULTISPECIES: pyridoxamine 5'-phosphate oxidase family protein [unclassified Lentimicrobium]|uniref:pyridoxamine 5'-phosphate oxidase family protein n=1 Tax=unclassified Lentimicrobium TaxID=2677434 RepID=UPI001551E48E|nr:MULTISPECIES: pyridoxamine 5'-phosphate oxidase family protein [unclassified Lentimicrobium]NPD47068.1 pyridoxamine 5'-phosphate oxidase family protein [Lentimicrobium sp. S6]NPD84420.1 pyridoxamine 5'-phosphate oxidase family protein [Lentimicrobium sp. L6]
MKTKINFSCILITLLFSFIGLTSILAQNTNSEEDKNKNIALEIINQASTCALITIDQDGQPIARMMQTLPTEKDFIIWLATNPKTRKAEHIKANEKVSIYYTEVNSTGYVSIQGIAELVNDLETKKARWKEGWKAYYQNMETDMVLIKIMPISMELVSYSKGVISKEENWGATKLKF